MQNQLPVGWTLTNIGNIAKVGQGGTPRRNVSSYWNGDIHWIRSGEVNNNLITDSKEKITKLGLKESSTVLCQPGTVLLAMTGEGITRGRSAILGIEACANQSVAHMIADKNCISELYLYYYLRSQYWQIRSIEKGTNQPGINTTIVKNLKIPLAPTEEQKRIVSKIEELIRESIAARKALYQVPQIMKKFRQSLLFTAFKGRLTSQDPNDESAIKLLERIRNERKKKWEKELKARGKDSKKFKYEEPERVDINGLPELPSGWVWSNVGEITENHDGKRVPVSDKERKKMSGTFPYYGASGIIDHVNNFLFDGNYLLVGEDGANLLSRSTPIAFIATRKFWVNNHAHVLTTFGDISLEFLAAYFNSIDLSKWVTGTAQPKLNQKRMNSIPVPLPPLQEQVRIVSRIEELFSFADQIKKSVEMARMRADKIDQSIFVKAFRGELVQQDPNDEPASVLLNTINVKKEKNQKHYIQRS